MEGLQDGAGAGLTDGGQMRVDDGRVEGLVPEVLTDLAQGDAFFEQVGGVGMTQAVDGGGGVDAAGQARSSLTMPGPRGTKRSLPPLPLRTWSRG